MVACNQVLPQLREGEGKLVEVLLLTKSQVSKVKLGYCIVAQGKYAITSFRIHACTLQRK